VYKGETLGIKGTLIRGVSLKNNWYLLYRNLIHIMLYIYLLFAHLPFVQYINTRNIKYLICGNKIYLQIKIK